MKMCVIGIGKFGYEVATVLTGYGIEVLAIDQDENKIEHIRDKVTHAACIKIIDADSLYRIGIEEIDGVIIALPNHFTQTAILARLLKNSFEINTVIAYSNDHIQTEILEVLGVDQTINPEIEAAARLADGLSAPFAKTTRLSESLSTVELAAPPKFIGKPLGELQLYENYHIKCFAIKRDEELLLTNNETIPEEGDVLFIASFNDNLKELKRRI